ncbi:cytochrome P450 [Bimuria novae-zelandiae CBS 107.79]|uniref:Cytochrome P450 n=1 Tax=Bimuria novae-zelandiae CBS 107.79 TaxID=1447943 RepID=A0A6A5VMK5_9PLEO|nr:cytochrome P450 [Bimuria novae-zelandiae CBS 107.79]
MARTHVIAWRRLSYDEIAGKGHTDIRNSSGTFSGLANTGEPENISLVLDRQEPRLQADFLTSCTGAIQQTSEHLLNDQKSVIPNDNFHWHRNHWRNTCNFPIFILEYLARITDMAISFERSNNDVEACTAGNRHHVVSSKEHWHDINNAHTSQLSPNAASREMFQPKYTFDFDWAAPREHVSLATVRSIRNMTQQLPSFQGRFLEILDQEFQKVVESNPQEDGWTRVALWPTVQRSVSRINTLLLLGEYTVSRLVTKLIKGADYDRKYVFRTLRALIAEREAYNKTTPEPTRVKPATFLEGVIDYSQDNRSTQQHVDSINSTWVISTLAIPVFTCQLLQDLYTQPKHFSVLQKECDAVPLHEPSRSHEISDYLEKLPLLEAFAMESWRTNCFQANTAHRMAMKPFQFSDGYKVPAGEIIEFHQYGLMNDDAFYPQHEKFDPSRFLGKNRSLVDTGIEWPFWGVPRYICPGRWHVANVEKLVAVYLKQNFEGKFESTEGLNFDWRDSLVPNPKMVLLMKPRSKG